ncbi:hypothetical protein GGH94_005585 [Coemansia aciculifera]|uniref:N-acetyltransferase domain-containing protein n=2 Tax=Coemansia TaxID=4863 RepID=A0A9W8GQ79_9FUNG|nr:hypothetical protein GGI19_006682 [Coemansia pectinata]KAJ2860329.1 hypothetical protein GGH94_005585 [Coemansia aciculifera]KAJ2870478.1 hypothetical protein GGH93_005540 [Coemansia aciculifera]
MTTPLNLVFRCLCSISEVHIAHGLESACYSSDEGASLETMLYRYKHAQHLFLGAFNGQTLVGYIMATQASGPLVTHKSMSTHDPLGTTVCIHSVCVSPQWQRQGVASMLLKKYTEMMQDRKGIRRLAMLSRMDLVPLYQRNGYKCLGPSNVTHGK